MNARFIVGVSLVILVSVLGLSSASTAPVRADADENAAGAEDDYQIIGEVVDSQGQPVKGMSFCCVAVVGDRIYKWTPVEQAEPGEEAFKTDDKGAFKGTVVKMLLGFAEGIKAMEFSSDTPAGVGIAVFPVGENVVVLNKADGTSLIITEEALEASNPLDLGKLVLNQ